MDFDAYVKSLGLDPTTLSADQHTRLEAAWRATQRTEPKPGDPAPKPPNQSGTAEIDAVTQATEADNQRKAGIAGLFKKFVNDAPDRVKEFEAVVRTAISGGLSVKDTEHELLKLSYVNGPLAFSPSKPQISSGVLEVAVARATGVARETIEEGYDDATLSAADKHFRGGCGLKRLIVTCARANGYRDADEGGFTGIGGTKQLLRAAFRSQDDDPYHGGAAVGFGPSTYDLSGILSNVMNKSIRDYFMAIEQTWSLICKKTPVSDFKQITGYALTGDLTYKKVAPGGEVKHGTLGEAEYTNKADLYALMLGIDYQHLRNDDMSAFSQINKRLGRGGALTINDVVWAAFLTTVGSFWSAGNGNYLAGTDYAFTLDKLANVLAAWDLRTDRDGKPMSDKARYLLTPTKWKTHARKYMESPGVSNDSGNGDTNPVAGEWTPISSAYLGNSSFTGSSADNYYLLCDPEELPVIEIVQLDGQEIPTIEMAEPDLSRLGIMVRGMHGFGVRRQEPRGGYKFKQTAD